MLALTCFGAIVSVGCWTDGRTASTFPVRESAARPQAADEPTPAKPPTDVPVHVRRRVTARSEPRDDANELFVANPIDDLDAATNRGEWTYVKLPNGEAGWIPTSEVNVGAADAQARITAVQRQRDAVENPTATPARISRERKNPRTATWLSVGTGLVASTASIAVGTVLLSNHTAEPLGWAAVVTGGLLVLAGPSFGHAYAGHTWSTGLALRLGGLAGGGLCTLGLRAGGGAFICILGGVGAIAVGAGMDMVTAGNAARAYNRANGIDASVSLAPIPTLHGAVPGIALGGSF
jgi:hypothetical protein